jgi:hypothetical protein
MILALPALNQLASAFPRPVFLKNFENPRIMAEHIELPAGKVIRVSTSIKRA